MSLWLVWCVGVCQLAIEEKGLEKDTSIRSTAMGVVPFKLLPEVGGAGRGRRGRDWGGRAGGRVGIGRGMVRARE